MKKTLIYRKEGQTQGATGTIIALVVGMGVAVLILIFVGLWSGTTYQLVEEDIDNIANNQVSEESFTAINNTVSELSHSSIQEGTLAIQNSTAAGGTAININNFTIDYDAGTVLLKSTADISLNNSAMLANYTWGVDDIRNSIKGGIVNGFNALETTGDYLPIIVLAIIITLVLGIVLTYTVISGGKGNTGTSL